eukprot:CAMPEP_0202969214 /NCGR_PEP_ID=MMETSP1396-20130829/14848_1 /ASSEMBLY_ACC=CAM_ASM_000872 /TAXON_ID= /ORGANISM="Pseudokeronopsis sp., Strain Brazil" /LENGTH=152 /DNA_ID=CAMNT_0049696477 /DNA_START=109 /DNA_END=567 /DNA_ORIENTATION=+
MANGQALKAIMQNYQDFIASKEFWGGLVLGLQQNPSNDDHQCYKGYVRFIQVTNTFIEDVDAGNSGVSATYTSQMNAQGNMGSFIGFYVFEAQQFIGLLIQFQDLYEVCEFSKILSQLGKILQTLPALGDALINGLFEYYNSDVNDIPDMID